MSMHDHVQHNNSDTNTVSSALSILTIGGIVTAGAIMLAPHALPAIGIGSEEMATRAMMILHDSSGLAGAINGGLATIPFIGSKLAEGGFFNAVATAMIGIGGVMLGDSIGQKENGDTSVRLGKFIKYGALATSALIALPTVLTAIGSGLIFLATLTKDMVFSGSIVSLVKSTLGTMTGVDHPMMGLSGFAATIPHFLTCGAALLPAALSLKLWSDDKKEATITDHPAETFLPSYSFIAKDKHGNSLPYGDPNHFMTPQEHAWVERYNSAAPAQKILLKKEILSSGYNPDFHADGTVHLYKHVHNHPAPVAMR